MFTASLLNKTQRNETGDAKKSYALDPGDLLWRFVFHYAHSPDRWRMVYGSKRFWEIAKPLFPKRFVLYLSVSIAVALPEQSRRD